MDALCQRQPILFKKALIKILQIRDGFAGMSGPFQAHQIQTAQRSTLAHDEGIGQNVLLNPR